MVKHIKIKRVGVMTEDRFKSIEVEISYLKQRIDGVNSDLKDQLDILRVDFKDILEKSRALSNSERKQIMEQLTEISKGLREVREETLVTKAKDLEDSMNFLVKITLGIVSIAGGVITYLAQKLGIF